MYFDTNEDHTLLNSEADLHYKPGATCTHYALHEASMVLIMSDTGEYSFCRYNSIADSILISRGIPQVAYPQIPSPPSTISITLTYRK